MSFFPNFGSAFHKSLQLFAFGSFVEIMPQKLFNESESKLLLTRADINNVMLQKEQKIVHYLNEALKNCAVIAFESKAPLSRGGNCTAKTVKWIGKEVTVDTGWHQLRDVPKRVEDSALLERSLKNCAVIAFESKAPLSRARCSDIRCSWYEADD